MLIGQWARTRVKQWKWCQYCERTIFRGEQAYRLNGSPYLVCQECKQKEGNKDAMGLYYQLHYD